MHVPVAASALTMLLAACSTLHGEGALSTKANPEPRDRLWRQVHDSCAPAAAQGNYPPLPCTEVDATRDYAVLKDRKGRFQYLVLPLARISGIESPALLAPGTPNYFADAWNARLYVEAAVHHPLPRDALVLIVNSAHGRSQDQLHIHVGCIRPDVRDALRHLLPTLGKHWHSLGQPLPPDAANYLAKWVPGESLSVDPIKSLAAALPTGDRMALHSLAVAGARSVDGTPGFILLSAHVDAANGAPGNSDALQDLDCAIAADSAH
jgi:CDP-diacylglycerol pyrophosphatase